MTTAKSYKVEENVTKSLNDPKDYRVLKLENGLTALLISEKDQSDGNQEKDGEGNGEKLSAAALCVGVGSFSDPGDTPGLAHFLEHMVFMGSEKYPNENEFDEFVRKQGGYNNAYTECEHTVFYFNSKKSGFKQGLDIFSGFFTKPLMKQGSVDREIKAVDSEFCMSKPRDRPRIEQLHASFAKKGHPHGKFTWGNLESLKETPSKQGIDLYNRLREFHVASYSAHYMTLAIQSAYPLDTLEQWVTEIFSAVPNNGLPRPTFYDLKEPFQTEDFTKIYTVIPCMNQHRLRISWSLPTLLKHYKSKPLHYIGFLVGHEGKGSIMTYLRKKMWAVSIEGGNSEYGYEHNTTQASFTVDAELTEAGLEHVNEVIGIVMQYIAMLRREGPKEWIYDEIKSIEDSNFRWIQEEDPVDYVETIAPNMLKFPITDYLTGDSLFTKYDPALISDCMNQLIPEKANIILSSKKFATENICNLKEKWFNTPYCCKDIPEESMAQWKSDQTIPELHLPDPNVFIATDFSLRDAVDTTQYPVAITDTPLSRLWYKQDTKFKVPRAHASFIFLSPVIQKSAETLCMFDLMKEILQHHMTETAYAASVANLSYNIRQDEHGLLIQVHGFGHKLLKLFQTVVDFIGKFSVEEDLLETMKKQIQRDYYNRSIKPTHLNKELRMSVLRQKEKTTIDCLKVLPDITVAMMQSYLKDIMSSVYVEGLVQGNLSAEEAKQFESYLIKELNCQPIPGHAVPETKIIELPIAELYVRTDNLNKNDENSVINNYYQHGPANYHQFELNELLMMRMEEPCFDILRTREQLGYSVYCTNRNTDGILGFTVTVCSQAHKFDLEKLDNRIENFLKEFQELLDKDTEADFETVKSSLITLKNSADSNLAEEVQRNWCEILARTYDFDIREKETTELKKITLPELREWFKTHILSSGTCKKLSIQVEGSKEAVKASKKKTKTDEVEDKTDKKDSQPMEQDGSDGEEDIDVDSNRGDDDGDDDESEDDNDEEVDMALENYTFTELLLKKVEGKSTDAVITSVDDLRNKSSFYPVSKLHV